MARSTRIQRDLQTLTGQRGTKADQAVRWKDIEALTAAVQLRAGAGIGTGGGSGTASPEFYDFQSDVTAALAAAAEDRARVEQLIYNTNTYLDNELADALAEVADIRSDLTDAESTFNALNATIVSDVSELTATVGENTSAITQANTARANADAALTTQINAISATVGQNAAAITAANTARANADSALSATITALTATVGENTAGITQANIARANAVSALAADITDLTASVGQNAAGISQANTARVNGDSALSGRINTLTSDFNGLNATVSQQATTLATLEGFAGATYSIRLSAGGASAGFEMVAADNPINGAASAIRFNADKILIDGTVDTQHLKADSVTAAKILSGQVRTEHLNVSMGSRNLIPDPRFMTTNAFRKFGTGGLGSQTSLYIRNPAQSWAAVDKPTLTMQQQGTATDGYVDCRFVGISADGNIDTTPMAVRGNQMHEFSVQLSLHRTGARLYIGWVRADGYVSYINTLFPSGPTSSSTNPDEWPRYHVRGVSPSWAISAVAFVRHEGTAAGSSDSYTFIYKPMFAETHQGTPSPIPFNDGLSTTIDGGMIKTGAIESTNYAPGSTGWIIRKDGSAEFNGVVLSRDMIVDSGSFAFSYVGGRYDADPTNPSNGLSYLDEYMFPDPIITNTPLTAWYGAKTTYIAMASARNWRVNASSPAINSNAVFWAPTAEIIPFTRWSGAQRLWLQLRIPMRAVEDIEPASGNACWIDWRIYKVT